MVMALPPMRDSAPVLDTAVLLYFHDFLAFLHRRFAAQSPPSHPLDLPL